MIFDTLTWLYYSPSHGTLSLLCRYFVDVIEVHSQLALPGGDYPDALGEAQLEQNFCLLGEEILRVRSFSSCLGVLARPTDGLLDFRLTSSAPTVT